MWRKGNPHTLLVGVQIGTATVENSMELPQKLKMGLLCDPAIPFLGIYLKKPTILIRKNMCTSVFITVLFTVAKLWKQPNCPSKCE